ncbi:class I SAM-dependent methyltransferase [Chryseobacterium koreense]|uniref:Methyltransferase n=1 Tax=Chryseobacterium koreense CCUG 49689 TaxID=1304281 RepID=A0A0J7IYR7_9FLAO|nr:class I SAM-dependent methyltransferase [Chryseobacterium koreense]KMQ71127.1 hypothetical protein ACM44_08065 [Chryseobacterium koreense CCUG 49689]MBB5332751.1 2-polyprenyl-3-methyl-5-hydroxy-6-metoxy-1,4-benzoquinol methylase [Chryseobacterium koreense]
MENTFEIFSKNYVDKPDVYYGNTRPEVEELIPVHCKTFLDVGCSDGSFGAYLKSKRQDAVVWGIEPHERFAKKAESVLDRSINSFYTAELQEIQNKTFDCISFNDVLEHLFDPKQALEISKNFLSDEGVVVASIPSVLFFHVFFEQIILKKEWKYTDGGTLDETHVRFFTRKSIQRLFEETGYEIIKLVGINKTRSKKFLLLNLATFGYFNDWKFMQFAVVAKKKK